MYSIKKMFKYVDNFLGNIISPSYCIGCQKRNEIFCNNCQAKIKLSEKPTEKEIFALFDYKEDVIKKAIWNLKYHKQWVIGKKFGQLLYENFIEEIFELKEFIQGEKILVIPVPISKKRKNDRGYNQSEKIAKSFCECNPKILKLQNNIILKIKNTIPQAKITNREKRLKNMIGVFDIKNKEIIKNRTIIIIDDVTTTGATIKEIIKILKRNGAKKIIGITIAH